MHPFRFTTDVHRRGYVITDRDGTRVITDMVKLGQKYRVRQIEPLDDVTMHTDFARITDEDDVVAYADRFGLLGIGGDTGVELVSAWLVQSEYFRNVVDVLREDRKSSAESERALTALNDFLAMVGSKMIDGELKIVPPSLLTAIWLQFALTLDMQREYRRCANERCRAWMEVSLADGARSLRAIYCGDACKKAAYRARLASLNAEPRSS